MTASRRHRVRRVYVLPNLFTAFNLALGLLAVINVLDGRIEKACWLVALAAILDGLDGAVARITHTQSEFGLQFDSLADLTSFGVAPAVIASGIMRANLGILHSHLLEAICILYAVCCALRLARYNIQSRGSERQGFLGLPTPGAAGVVVTPALMIRAFLPDASGGWQTFAEYAYPGVVLATALLMVSEVPYAKVTRALRLRGRLSFETLVSYILIAIVIWALQSDVQTLTIVLFVLTFLYVGYGLVRYLLNRMLGRSVEQPASRPSAEAGPGDDLQGRRSGSSAP